MKNFKLLLIFTSLIILQQHASGQLLETRHLVSVNVGYGTLNGQEGNLFFPEELSQSTLNVDLNYGRKIKNWLAGGLSFGYQQLSSPTSNPGFAQVNSSNGQFLTLGPQLVFHSPHKNTGVYNWLRLGCSITPQFHHYSGDRTLLIDNEVLPINESGSIRPEIDMESKSSGFGAKLSPEVNLRITQRLGFRLAYHLQFLDVYSGFDREPLINHSVLGGMILTLGNYKQFFL
jgi:hypothetical protein